MNIPSSILLINNSAGSIAGSEASEGTILLSDIQNLSVSSNRLNWEEQVLGESGFSIKASEKSIDNFVEVGSVGVGAETYDHTGLLSGIYNYRIDAIGDTVLSNIKSTQVRSYQKEYRFTSAGQERLVFPHGADINFERTSAFSIRILAKWDSSAIGQYIVFYSKRDTTGPGIQFFKSDAEKCYLVLVGSTQVAVLIGTATMAANQLHDIVLSFGGNHASVSLTRFIIDGKLDITTINTNNLTNQTVTNSADFRIGTRLNSPIYANWQCSGFQIFNTALDFVNLIPNIMWNDGLPRPYTTNCVRDYRFNTDSYLGGVYTVVASIGTNGTSVNMLGDELVNINSISSPIPLNVKATPKTLGSNTIFWDSCGFCTYDIEFSLDGVSGWTTLATNINETFYHHSIGIPSALRYYRVKSNGDIIESSYSDVVSATTLSIDYFDAYYFSTHARADNSYNFGLSVETQRVTDMYYDTISNRTYKVYMSRAEQGYDMAIFILYYDHAEDRFSESFYVGIKSRQGQDRHPIPAVIVANDGHIIVCATDFHNGPLQIYRSDLPGNIKSFTRLGELGTVCDYPEFRKFSDGSIVIFHRYYVGSSQAGLALFRSTDHCLTFGSQLKILEYPYGTGRPYPMMMQQTEASDVVTILGTPRNDTGGPFAGDPDKGGYFKDYGMARCNYGVDGINVWRNIGNSFSQNVNSSGPILAANWQSSFLYHDSVGTQESGLPVGMVTPAGIPYVATYDDSSVYKVHFWNGSSFTHTTLSWSDGLTPSYFDGVNTYQSYTFGYHGIQAIVYISGSGASMVCDLYVTYNGVVKRYRNTDGFTSGTCTLQDANVLPNVNGIKFERGTVTNNIYQTSQPFLIYSAKTSEPTPTPTSPNAYSDFLFKKLW